MQFIDDLLRLFGRGGVLFPVFRVCAGKIQHHTPYAIHTAGHPIGVRGFINRPINQYGIVIVGTIQIFQGFILPKTPGLCRHWNGLLCRTIVPCGI